MFDAYDQTSGSDVSWCKTNSSGRVGGENESKEKSEASPRVRGEKRRDVAIIMFQEGNLYFSAKS